MKFLHILYIRWLKLGNHMCTSTKGTASMSWSSPKSGNTSFFECFLYKTILERLKLNLQIMGKLVIIYVGCVSVRRMFHQSDEQSRSAYPMMVRAPIQKRVLCRLCYNYKARLVRIVILVYTNSVTHSFSPIMAVSFTVNNGAVKFWYSQSRR